MVPIVFRARVSGRTKSTKTYTCGPVNQRLNQKKHQKTLGFPWTLPSVFKGNVPNSLKHSGAALRCTCLIPAVGSPLVHVGCISRTPASMTATWISAGPAALPLIGRTQEGRNGVFGRNALNRGDNVGTAIGSRFRAGLPFPVPEAHTIQSILWFGRNFPECFSGGDFPREPPEASLKQPQPSRAVWPQVLLKRRKVHQNCRIIFRQWLTRIADTDLGS